jgi:hypothetical protein
LEEEDEEEEELWSDGDGDRFLIMGVSSSTDAGLDPGVMHSSIFITAVSAAGPDSWVGVISSVKGNGMVIEFVNDREEDNGMEGGGEGCSEVGQAFCFLGAMMAIDNGFMYGAVIDSLGEGSE